MGRDQAPAEGRLAAAMATNWANRRPILDGALRNSFRTLAISHVPWRPGHRAHSENGPYRLSSRDISENSNARFADSGFRCGIFAPFRPAAEEFFAAGPAQAIKPLPDSRPAKRSLLFSLISRLLSPEASSSRRGRLSGPARNLSYGKGSQTAGNRPVPVWTRVCALC